MEAKQRRTVIASAVLGLVIPVILLRLDPFVLGGQDGDSMLGNFSHAAYVLMLLAMVAFLVQLIPGRRPSFLSATLSGALLAGSLISGVVGILVLPFSVVGIQVYGIGLLGFYPFVTAVLYLKSARSAFSSSRLPSWQAFSCALGGCAIVIAIPVLMLAVANRELDRLATMARSGSDQTRLAWRVERYLTWAGDLDKIVRAYRGAIGSQHQGDVALLYRNLTGQGIDVRLRQLTGHPD